MFPLQPVMTQYINPAKITKKTIFSKFTFLLACLKQIQFYIHFANIK